MVQLVRVAWLVAVVELADVAAAMDAMAELNVVNVMKAVIKKSQTKSSQTTLFNHLLIVCGCMILLKLVETDQRF